MIKKLIAINKLLSEKTHIWFNNTFGLIDQCENYYYNVIMKKDLKELTVIEIGGTQRPIFKKRDIKKYIGLDIDENFNWENHYHKYLNQSCTEPFGEKADFISSKYLLEHVNDNKKTFTNIIDSLNTRGFSIHVFPLGFHPYSMLTRLVGNSLQKKLIAILRPETTAITGYPVHFDLCNSLSLKSYLKKNNLIDYEVKYYYGASEYFFFFFPFYLFIEVFNRFCHFTKFTMFASNAVLIIHKK